MRETKTYSFHVKGMHCPACVLLTESELQDLPQIEKAKATLATCSVEVTGRFDTDSPETIAEQLSQTLQPHGYTVVTSKPVTSVNWKDFKIAVPIALGFIALFILLQKLGIVNLITSDKVTYGTAFFVGIIASLSTCMAVVGGLVLSMSATFAQTGDKVKPQLLFHVGRIISFFVLGGVIGAIGSSLALGVTGMFVLSVLIGSVMILLGLNLLDIFPWTKLLTPTMPKFLSHKALNVTKFNHTLTPALLGIITFFLPCGFTQSMQIYSLSTGSFLSGGLTMLAFALGTLPVLALVSFSSLTIGKSLRAGIFFKTAGLIVIVFGLFNLYSSLVAIGALPHVFNF